MTKAYLHGVILFWCVSLLFCVNRDIAVYAVVK